MTLKPPTRTLPKVVMKEWPEKLIAADHSADGDWNVELEYQQNEDGSILVTNAHRWKSTIDGALSDFTRVVEETGVLDQKEAQRRKRASDHE